MDDINEDKQPQENFFKDIIKFSILALVIVIPIRFFIAQPFIVSGASMQPTFESGEYLIVDQLTYRFESAHRGEVVIFKYPKDPSKYFIKRVIGLPGETVRIEGEHIYIENEEHQSGYLLEEPYLDPENLGDSTMTITLSDDQYFVMGDNRRASSDSRIWGPLPEENIIGRAFLRLLPITNYAVLPGSYEESSH